MSTLSIIGLLIIGFAAAQNKREWMALRNGHKTTGKVIDVQPEVNSFNGGTQHTHEYPIVEYKDAEGYLKRDQMNTFNRIGKYKLGDEIEIILYENKLHHRKINYLRSIAIGAVGILIFILGIL